MLKGRLVKYVTDGGIESTAVIVKDHGDNLVDIRLCRGANAPTLLPIERVLLDGKKCRLVRESK